MQKVSTLQNWWKKYGQIVILIIIILLTSIISFKYGQISTHNDTKVDVVVRDIKNINPAQEKANMAVEALKRQGVDIHQEQNKQVSKRENEDCLFVASRNSKKYHTKDCKYGKKIKESNLVCFKSIEEAKNKGYLPAGGCLGKH